MSQKIKQRPGVQDVGFEYQIKVITFIASSLANNRFVEDFVIYTNLPEIPGYDDVVACVLFKNNNILVRKAYLIQVKHRNNKITFVTEKHNLKSYKNSYNNILGNKQNIKCLREIKEEDIKFYFFSNNYVNKPLIVEKGKDGSPDLQYTIESVILHDDILDCKQNSRFILKIADGNQNEYNTFFNNFYLYLNQPDNDKISTSIQLLHGEQFTKENTNSLINIIKEHFTKKICVGLSKTIFELQVLKINLSQWVVKPSRLRMMNKEQAMILNNIILKHDVTIISDSSGIEGIIFGCLLWQFNNVYGIDFDWNSCLTEGGTLKKFFNIGSFIERARSFKEKYTWSVPETLEQLLLEMWKFGHFPLILRPYATENIQNTLTRYKSLRKHFILISNRKNYQFPSDVHIFKHVGNIDELALQDELLRSMRVSLQGRDVVNLKQIVGHSTEILRSVTVERLLKLIQKRIIIKKEGLYNTQHIIFLLRGNTKCVKDLIAPSPIHVIKDLEKIEFNCTENIFIDISEYTIEDVKECIQESNKFENYILHHIELSENKCEVITEHFNGISEYIFEECPRIGNELDDREFPYIERVFKKILLKEDALYANGQNIFLLSGGLISLRRHINTIIREYPVDPAALLSLYENENAIVHLTEDKVHECWNEFLLATARPMFYLRATYEGLELLRWRNYSTISRYLETDIKFFGPLSEMDKRKLYTVDESRVFDYYGNQLIAITADPGMGKTSTLQSLSRRYTPYEYVISVNLANCRSDLEDPNNDIFSNPLDYFFNKMESDNPDPLLKTIYDYQKLLKKVGVFLDSFDEILPLHGEETLLLIKKMLSSQLRIWIASRPQANVLIEKQFDIIPITLSSLTKADVENYIRLKNISEESFRSIPQKFLANPLHLNLTTALAKDNILNLDDFDVIDVYRSFIEMKINIYFNKMKIDKNSRHLLKAMETFLIEGHQTLALILMYGKEKILNSGIITQNELSNTIQKFDTYEYSMGLIIIINKGNPLFVHQTYAEYLAAEWLFLKRHEHYFQRIYHDTMEMPRYGNICNFFNRLLCRKMSLHMAVLNANLSARQIHEVHDRYAVDDCGRNILHLATHCSRDADDIQTYQVIETIINCFDKDKINLRDNFLKWTWLDYTQKVRHFFDSICAYGLKSTVQLYLGQINLKNISLHAAARNGRCDVIELLINRGDLSIKENGNTALYLAAKHGHLDVVQTLLNNGDNVLSRNEMESTPLHAAADGGYLKIVELLLDNGASVLVEDADGKTVIYRALESGHKDVVCMILQLGFEMSKTDRKGKSGLHSALENGHVDLVIHLLKHNYNTKIHDSDGTTVLHWAVEGGFLKVVTKLLEDDCDISKPDINGQTPLHVASSKGFENIVDILLRKKANVLCQNNNGETPLHLACKYNYYNIVKSLISQGAPLSVKDSFGETPLYTSSRLGYLDIAQLLLSVDMDELEKDELSRSALRAAVGKGHTEIAKVLLQRGIDLSTNFGTIELDDALKCGFEDVAQILIDSGADISYKSHSGETVLISAVRRGFTDIVRTLLFKKKMDPSVITTYDDSPLSIACEDGNEDIADALLQAKANVHRKDKFGRTALQRATQNGHFSIILLLLKYGANINETNEYGKTILMLAMEGRYLNVCRYLIDNNIDLHVKDIHGKSAIDYAFTLGDADLVKLLIYKTNTKHIASATLYENMDNNLETLDFLLHSKITITNELHMLYWKRKDYVKYQNKEKVQCNGSCQTISSHKYHCIKCLQQLLIEGNNIDEKNNKFGRTQLHWAVIYADKDLVTFLIAQNADVNVRDNYGNTCLHHALNQVRGSDFLEVLLKSGADTNSINHFKETPLHVTASKEWSWNVIEKLLKYGGIVDKGDSEGNTPLHLAILGNCNTTAQYILQESNVMTSNNKGNAPLHSAVINCNYSSVLDLLESGADVNTVNSNGDTALHLVKSSISDRNITKCLVQYGALLTAKNNQGNTPLHMFVLTNNDACFEIVPYKTIDKNIANNDGETVLDLAKKLKRISHQALLTRKY